MTAKSIHENKKSGIVKLCSECPKTHNNFAKLINSFRNFNRKFPNYFVVRQSPHCKFPRIYVVRQSPHCLPLAFDTSQQCPRAQQTLVSAAAQHCQCTSHLCLKLMNLMQSGKPWETLLIKVSLAFSLLKTKL